jgi:hypothetical protein
MELFGEAIIAASLAARNPESIMKNKISKRLTKYAFLAVEHKSANAI